MAGSFRDSSRRKAERPTASFHLNRRFKPHFNTHELTRGSGGLYRLGFGRPGLCGSLDELRQQGSDITESAFDRSALCSAFGQNGSLGRNVLRGPMQSRFDLGILKKTNLTENVTLELGADVFNVFNRVNFANPDFELGSPDFGRITSTVGGPRVMQFKAKVKF